MSDSDGGTPQVPLSRPEKVELFSEEHVQRSEWSAGERELIDAVRDELRAVVDERDDTRVTRIGTSFSDDGFHEVTLTVRIAGNAWVGLIDRED